MRIPLFLAALCFTTSWALHAEEAGVVDWHQRLIGVPLSEFASLAPRFHSWSLGGSEGDESLIVTATEANALAALHPQNGSVGEFPALYVCNM
jgi:hypothetical protein